MKKISKTQAYKDGLQTGLEDWSLTGAPHRSRKLPDKYIKKRTDWFLGRCHGFKQAERLIRKDLPDRSD